MEKLGRHSWLLLLLAATLVVPVMVKAQTTYPNNDIPTGFSNKDSVRNTRHNLQQDTEATNGGATMNPYRNRYGREVCVYCHTPHAATTAAPVPLWNRSLPTSTTYTTYGELGSNTLTQTVSQPGAASLTCLSCHDGQQAVDAVYNMPGSGQYSATADPTTFTPTASGYVRSGQHRHLGGPANTSCLACHDDGTNGFGDVAANFTVAAIGTDLSNDHPIGVMLPTGGDWNVPNGTFVAGTRTSKFFDDAPNNGRMDKTEIRLYDSGDGAKVECASCHDPHGVPSGGSGTTFNLTFLRKTNAGSTVCLVCHAK